MAMRLPIPWRPSGWTFVTSLGLLAFSLTGPFAALEAATPVPPTAEQLAFFESKVRPVLVTSCQPCHGSQVQMGGLRLDSFAAILKGGDTGPALIPGDPEKSLLVRAIRQSGPLKMPKGRKLSAAEIADIENWVRMGAPWPKGQPIKKAEKAPLWSLQPVKMPPTPKVKNAAWLKNPLDAYVLAQLESKELSPAPAADRRTLLRRVTYDLTGLPPTPEDTDSFLSDKSPDAYEKVVDRLLASPRYGERWARMWLDVARYADTKGYVFEEDRNYYNAYTYRDWVIRAFNEDLPYDRFIIEQLAADRLPEIQNGDDRRSLAALGFLTIGRRFLNQTPDIIDDRIDVTMRGFQGFTVACARCHDHKFDPIPTQDYYSLYGIFDSSEERPLPISPKPIREPWEAYNERAAGLEEEIRASTSYQIKRLRERASGPTDGVSPETRQVLQSFREDVIPNAETLAKLLPAFEPAGAERLTKLQTELTDLRRNPPVKPELAMGMVDGANPHDGVVFKRGNPGNPGPVAPRRFLLALSKAAKERPVWTTGSGRLELARSIASPENPLTARVFVNRVWQGHFGAAIVRTPSDFGHQGEPPTNPALLDYLAARFMADGWSIKKLHRLIVTSATYRQSSDVPEAVLQKDPENRNWGRMNRRRLDLEQMRDTLIAASGHLDVSHVGGKSVDLWSMPFTRRRAVYGFIERQNLPGIFRTFDFASPDSTSARRFYTTVPQQALFFMNSPFAAEQARSLSQRPEIRSATSDAQGVRRLYRLLFDRYPDEDETKAGIAYLSRGRVPTPLPVWEYGYGHFDPAKGRVASFVSFLHFGDGGYRAGQSMPDADLGYLLLTAQGGHPGRDANHAVIRRWVAPQDLTVQIQGLLQHPNDQGDGVHALLVSSRDGVVGEWTVHNGSSQAEVKQVTVRKGDTLDFIVEPRGSDSFDSFAWAPTIHTLDGSQTWDSAQGFQLPGGEPLSRTALYAQALMMTNEFVFVD